MLVMVDGLGILLLLTQPPHNSVRRPFLKSLE